MKEDSRRQGPRIVDALGRSRLSLNLTFLLSLALGQLLYKNHAEMVFHLLVVTCSWVLLSAVFGAIEWRTKHTLRFASTLSPFLSFLAPIFMQQNNSGILYFLQVAAVWLPLWLLCNLNLFVLYRRKIIPFLVSLTMSLFLLHLAGPTILRKVVLKDYTSSIDHILKPRPGRINSDGVQPDKPSSSYKKEDFNIIFLGDSFCFGSKLDKDKRQQQAFAFLVGKILQDKYPDKHIRIADFGWPSSSPILQLRQMHRIGAAYKPDMVVQVFDMTDVYDDVRYEKLLAMSGKTDPKAVSIFEAMEKRFSMLIGMASISEWFWNELFFTSEKPVPKDRFFLTMHPLDETRSYFRHTWRAIRATRAYSRSLGAEYALVILPRYQQYNRRECPHDWEGQYWPTSDQYVLEPFRYFDEKAKTVNFPVFSLLGDFKNSGVFPTTFDADPHYNPAGHRIAAKGIADRLIRSGLIK